MKIDGKNPSIQPLSEKVAIEKKAKVETAKAPKASQSDSVNTQLSRALRSVLEGIEASGLTAGEVHSNVSVKSVQRLLDESPVSEVKAQLSEKELLSLADSVASAMLSNPRAAAQAIGDVYPERVTELLA